MLLTEPVAAAGLPAAVAAVLDQRLRRGHPRPVAVALSGGGDSVALLLAARQWARGAGRDLLVLTVDHRLQPDSAAWTAACAARAARLGLRFEALAWTGPKPDHGLPAAARAARHRLLADAARAAGARVLLLGHTADDVLEAQAMRAAGATTPDPRAWSPSPAWPAGRDLFLLRPLLGLRRAAIRAWLAAQGEAWIEDPANADPRFARARARAALAADAARPTADDPPTLLAEAVEGDRAGGLRLDREAVRRADPAAAARVLATAAVCAGGGARIPPRAAVARLADRLGEGAPIAATLAGARIEADAQEIRWLRDAGERARGGLAPVVLTPGQPVVWDGRFELLAARPGLTVRALAGGQSQLPAAMRPALAALPAAARPGLPAIIDATGALSCPLLAAHPDVAVRELVSDRFAAACGLVAAEPV